jgi:N-acyl-D-aspartate/D-glutamate deacylase
MTTKWDKIDGDRQRSKPLPSTFARLKEFRVLNRVLRKYDRILQGAPDIVTKYNMFFFLWESAGIWRKKLKTTLITLADTKSNPILYLFAMSMGKVFNWLLNADFKWQALPCRFQVFADGMDLVVFEEFGAGEEALHIADQIQRNQLLADKSYRKRFTKDYKTKFSPRVWHRNFGDAFILDCPNPDYINKSFSQLASEQAVHPVDFFLDTVIEFGNKLRWTTTIANHRRKALERIISSDATIISFSDAGAHLRNMAFYNFPLQMLKMVKDAQDRGEPFMTTEKAVHRLTGELADWFGLNTGKIEVGAKADCVIIDPAGLNGDVLEIKENIFPEMNGMKRLTNRNDKAIEYVFINGKPVFQNNDFMTGYGKDFQTGIFLEARL